MTSAPREPSPIPSRPGRPGPVLVDGDGFTRRVLLSGEAVPWSDTGALGGYFSRCVGLLQPDAVLVDVATAWTPGPDRTDLLDAMHRQTRRGRALRTLLGDGASTLRVAEVLRAVAAATRLPVVAVIPSPGRWAALANGLAGVGDLPVDDDTVDAAAMYVAGALGTLADVEIAAILIDEGDAGADDLPDPDAYTPVANAAGHVGRSVWVRTDNAPAWASGDVPSVGCWIGAAPPTGTEGRPWGLVGPLGPVPGGSTGAPRIVAVPEDSDPDVVAAAVRSWE
ncbi:hypothetical protein [Nostocoides japonicum]|nr:hypothetical protein [Tetrasphaera japonica]